MGPLRLQVVRFLETLVGMDNPALDQVLIQEVSQKCVCVVCGGGNHDYTCIGVVIVSSFFFISLLFFFVFCFCRKALVLFVSGFFWGHTLTYMMYMCT